MADEDTLEAQLGRLSDADLLATINATLAKRQTPPTPEEAQATTEDDGYAEFEQYFPDPRQARSPR